MSYRTKMLIRLGMAGLAMVSSAAGAAPGWSTPFQIAKIIPREYNIDMITVAPITSPMGCSRIDAIRLQMSATNYAAISAVLITAFSTGKTVTAWIVSCDTDNVSVTIAVSVDK